jgi:hypothetical protein
MRADDYLFVTSEAAVFDGLKTLGHGRAIDDDLLRFLATCGLADDEGLTSAGRALFQLHWVHRSADASAEALGAAMRTLVSVQVIEQETRGFGALAEEGVLQLLLLHRAVPPDFDVDRLRPTLKWLNRVGLVKYSQKFKTVRSLAPLEESMRVGEDRRLAAMVSPRTPYSNIVRLRRILRGLHGTVWWVDPHFSPRALEDLAEELDATSVAEVRILCGEAAGVLTRKGLNDFARFATELDHKGIAARLRVDRNGVRDWHDRWISDDDSSYNVPPVNTLYKGDWSELLPTDPGHPFDLWWARSLEPDDL